jgi:hypothetical protein
MSGSPRNTLENIYRVFDTIIPDEYGCHLYPRSGHQIKLDGKQVYVSRIALERKLGRPIRPGFCALHNCDYALCVNPDHLYEGTKKDNAQDREERYPECHYNNHSLKLEAWRKSQEFQEHMKRIGIIGRNVRWNQNTNTKK